MILNKIKKAQEEMIGFVLIVVLIVIILLVFLMISLNSPSEPSGSLKMKSFLNSMTEYTSGCADRYETNFHSLVGLIAACREQEDCLDSKNSCEVLKKDLKGMLNASWQLGMDELTGYQLQVISDKNSLPIVNITNGNLSSSNYFSESISFMKGGKIEIFFNTYHSS